MDSINLITEEHYAVVESTQVIVVLMVKSGAN